MLEEKQQTTVTEIYVDLRLEQSVASQHLMEAQRKGNEILYKPNYNNLTKLERIVSEIITEVISD